MQNVCLQGTLVYIVEETSEQKTEVYMHEKGVIIHLKLQENCNLHQESHHLCDNKSVYRKKISENYQSLLPSPLDCGFFLRVFFFFF